MAGCSWHEDDEYYCDEHSRRLSICFILSELMGGPQNWEVLLGRAGGDFHILDVVLSGND